MAAAGEAAAAVGGGPSAPGPGTGACGVAASGALHKEHEETVVLENRSLSIYLEVDELPVPPQL